MAQREDRREEYVDVRIPAALADRIDRVFADCRGYESSSMQESLSVLCDLAAGRLDVPRSAARTGSTVSATTTASSITSPPDGDDAVTFGASADADPAVDGLDDDRRANIDAAFPTRWSAEETVATQLAAVVDRYVENPNDVDDDEREADALHTVGEAEGLAPDELRDRLVTALYGNTGLPDDLAGEFFSDALATVADAEAAAEADAEDAGTSEESMVEDGVDVPDSPIFDEGAPALTDGPPAKPAQPARNVDPEAAFDSPTDEVTVDSLLADEAAPTARCESCEAYHPVDDLETVIGSKSATIELLCESCATAVEENN
jgi:hypothetical protein